MSASAKNFGNEWMKGYSCTIQPCISGRESVPLATPSAQGPFNKLFQYGLTYSCKSLIHPASVTCASRDPMERYPPVVENVQRTNHIVAESTLVMTTAFFNIFVSKAQQRPF